MAVSKPITVPFTIHPRAFKALGADLVTNDVVAIIELVKNAYDAYATEVEIRIRDEDGAQVLEIEDNGSGMTRETIVEAWCTVATPYRTENPIAKRAGKRNRRTSGAKGLGRLSAARLGSQLSMTTQTEGGECWNVQVDWDSLTRVETIDKCVVTLTANKERLFRKSGTLLRITPLRASWSDALIDDLRDNLARLLPPFELPSDFTIRLSKPGLFDYALDVSPPVFLEYPKYMIKGEVDVSGKVRYRYEYKPILGGGRRSTNGTISWSQIREGSSDASTKKMVAPRFGPFSFEIRGWDIGPDDTQEISERFDMKKASVRRDIKAYKGVSVYRDDVLVLPKSEGARDWLGLDLRRVGKVGPRMSTTQLVGYVAITAAENARLEDTSDRERLASTPEVIAFEEALRTIVERLEQERQKDKSDVGKERRVVDLFNRLSAKDLVSGVAEVASEGGPASDALPLVEEFSANLDKAREEIETRFVYYSRLASVGTIAHMLIHEVRNRTGILGHVFGWLGKRVAAFGKERAVEGKVDMGRDAVASLDKLADTFAPLANRQFKRRMRTACIEESVLRCFLMLEGDLKAGKIVVTAPKDSATEVAVDPGELDAVLLNLLANAVYWVSHHDSSNRRIKVRVIKHHGDKRILVEVLDSGPGVTEEDAEKIFLPGVTNKPSGIGMGLTVASELVAEYGGKLGLEPKGKLGGATFFFDLPLK